MRGFQSFSSSRVEKMQPILGDVEVNIFITAQCRDTRYKTQ
jgi:hypothetical protein